MRTIDGALLTAQKALSGKPTFALTVGATDLTSYLLGYDYSESLSRSQPITLTLNNASGYFNASPPAQGNAVELLRGIGGVTAELPRFWVEGVSYTYEAARALCIVKCIDWWARLATDAPATDQDYAATSATTILEWILTQAGLTRAAGAMTAPLLTFTIRATETHAIALRRLLQKIPEKLYAGLDAQIKWKLLPDDEASVYTFGWNDANHQVMNVRAGSVAWQYNTVTVYNATYTGSNHDDDQIALVGERAVTIYDAALASDADCLSAANAALNLYAAEAITATITCRPCHGLELLDVVTMDSPPWGGDDVVSRVLRFRETYGRGTWQQQITLGKR